MCTVSVIIKKEKAVFTFNRDEKVERYTANFFVKKNLGFKKLYYPSDSKAGGSWFVTDNKGNFAMLFNGAFKKHYKRKKYLKSRGLLLLEIAAQQKMKKYFEEVVLHNIEPFSIILMENRKLWRLSWNGIDKTVTPLSKLEPHIFSSATLYTKKIQEQRKILFANTLHNKNNISTSSAIMDFHSNNLIINDRNGCSTLSISQAEISNKAVTIKHFDLIANKKGTYRLNYA